MSISRLTGGRGLAALGLVMVLALAGCNEATATPTSGSTPTATPGPTTQPTTEPGATAISGGSGPDIGGATAALGNLSSYRFAIAIFGFGLQGPTAEAPLKMDGTAVLKPAKALKFSITGGSEGGAARTYIIVGTDSWVAVGAGTFIREPAPQDSTENLFELIQPDKLFQTRYSHGGLLGVHAAGWLAVRPEQKNGVATVHYHIDKDSPGGAELVPTWGQDAAFDVWVASDDGYLVSVHASGEQAGAGGGPFEVGFDITNIDDPANVVSPPS